MNIGMYAWAEKKMFFNLEEFGLTNAEDFSINITRQFANTVAHVILQKWFLCISFLWKIHLGFRLLASLLIVHVYI